MKNDGLAALHIAVIQKNWDITAILLSQHVHATVDLCNNKQQMPLHIATHKEDWSLVKLLVHHNADISRANCDDDTVLHIAILKSKENSFVPAPDDSPLIYTIWQNLERQGLKKTKLALACFFISVDKSGKLLEHARGKYSKTLLELLEHVVDPLEVTLYTDILRSYKYQSCN